MEIVEKFIQYANKKAQEEPEKGWDRMLMGFKANCFRTRFLPKKGIAAGYQKLENMMMRLVADSLSHKDSYVWGNIFAPCEIMHAFGMNSLSIECLACFLTGYHLEDYFIDFAQDLGVAPTLCSYHKTFVGAVTSGVVPAPSYAVTTSLSCDGNLNTFRFLQKKKGVGFTLLDVPYKDDEAAVGYLAGQLEEMVQKMEKVLGKPFDMGKLRQELETENETRKELKKLYQLLQVHYYPGEVVSQLYLMMGVHLLMGKQEFLELIQFMNKEIEGNPVFEGKKILWVHLIPFYQETLQHYFNSSRDYQVLASDIVLDCDEELDVERPYEALAEKLLRNVFNGSYKQKTKRVLELMELYRPDAVIHFNHWGCKQASGGSILLKEEMKKRDVPMLILDGDGIDKRNSHDGQIKTRLEAFLEMLE